MKATAPAQTTNYHQQSVKNIIAEEPVQVEEPRFDVDRPADLGYSVWETIQVLIMRLRIGISKPIKSQRMTPMFFMTFTFSRKRQ